MNTVIWAMRHKTPEFFIGISLIIIGLVALANGKLGVFLSMVDSVPGPTNLTSIFDMADPWWYVIGLIFGILIFSFALIRAYYMTHDESD